MKPFFSPWVTPTVPLMAPLMAVLLAVLLATPPAAQAGPGHDHGHDHAEPAATGTALPRFAAVSELFELVGVLDGRQLTLYLDRAADNAPVTGAQIELEIAGAPFRAEVRDDTYTVQLPAAPGPGVLPVTATVTAGTELDLLAGELELHTAAHAAESTHAHPWSAYAGWAGAGLAALGLAACAVRRSAVARKQRAARPSATAKNAAGDAA